MSQTQKITNLITTFPSARLEMARKVAKNALTYWMGLFDIRQDKDGNVWQNKKDGEPSYLIDTGNLYSHLRNSIWSTTADKIEFRVPVEYASYLREGTSKMPARPFFEDSYQLREIIEKIINEEIEKWFNQK